MSSLLEQHSPQKTLALTFQGGLGGHVYASLASCFFVLFSVLRWKKDIEK